MSAPTIENAGPRSEAGPITFADVLAAVPVNENGELQPNAVNASAIRVKLGRGSNSTIQGHLDVIRAQVKEKKEAPFREGLANDLSHTPPKDILNSLWQQACDAVNAKVLQKYMELQSRYDELRESSSQKAEDLKSALMRSDELQSQADFAEEQMKALQAQIEHLNTQHEKQIEALNRSAQETQQKLEKQLSDSLHSLEMQRRDFDIERLTMQKQIESLNDRLADAKAALMKSPVVLQETAKPAQNRLANK